MVLLATVINDMWKWTHCQNYSKNDRQKWQTGIKNFCCNYKLLLLMQLLGKRLSGMAIVTALFSIHSTLGN